MAKKNETKTTKSTRAQSVFFGSINDKLRARSRGDKGARQRAERDARKAERRHQIVVELVWGKRETSGGKGKERVERALNPATTIERALMFLKLGGTADEFAELVQQAVKENEAPDFHEQPLAKRFDWAEVRDSILGWAKQSDVSLTDISLIFGLVENGDAVVDSEKPDVDEKPARKSKANTGETTTSA